MTLPFLQSNWPLSYSDVCTDRKTRFNVILVSIIGGLWKLCECVCVWMIVNLIRCDLKSPHVLFQMLSLVMLRSLVPLLLLEGYTHSLIHSHSCLTYSNPWISRAALKIKFLPQIIFLVIRKYTCSPREECSDAMATWRLLTSPSTVSLVFGCFCFLFLHVCICYVPLHIDFVLLVKLMNLQTTFFNFDFHLLL